MTFVFVGLAAAVVFVIAAVVVGREARRLDGQSPRPVFDVEEAVAWVAERLDGDVTARLGYDDVRSILEWSLERLPVGGEDAMVADDEAVAHVVARAIVDGRDLDERDVWAVLDQESRYLREIGAVGSPSPEKGGGPAEG